MTRRRPRGLRPDEAELWGRVVETARPLDPARSDRNPLVLPAPREHPPRPADHLPHAPTAMKLRPHGAPEPATRVFLQPGPADRVAGEPVRMDRKAFDRLVRGKLKPEARIDLHGMTVAEAHSALLRTILRAQAEGMRLVLVVTGKGRDRDEGGPIPAPRGILRHQVPQWLRQPPLAPAVLQVAEAHQRHGGGGAYYVYLRRNPRAV